MLLETAIILAVLSAALEIYLVLKFGVARKYLCRYSLLALIFSFLLSLLLGVCFGATGLIVMVAGVGSTVLTIPFYIAMRLWDKVRRVPAYGK